MKPYLTVLLLMMASVSFGQTPIATVEKAPAVTGIAAPKIVGNYVLMEAGSKPVIGEVATVKINAEAKAALVIARKTLDEIAPVETVVEGKEYVFAGKGRYVIEITLFDPGIRWAMFNVTLGDQPGPDPGPGPGPEPGPVPPDQFDNIGQRVAKWSAGLPKRAEVSAIYLNVAIMARENPITTSAISAELINQLNKALGSDKPLYKQCADNINADLSGRWPMARGTYADYLEAISRGYK